MNNLTPNQNVCPRCGHALESQAPVHPAAANGPRIIQSWPNHNAAWAGMPQVVCTRMLLGALCFVLVLAGLPAWADAACTVLQTAGELTTVLTWNNNDTVTTDTVNILRSNTSGTEILELNVPYGTTFTDTVPPVSVPSITYFYEVQAKGPGGVSPVSNEACKTFFQGPPAPTGLTAK